MNEQSLKKIEIVQNTLEYISSEWYRLSEVTLDHEYNNTIPSDIIDMIDELGTQIKQIEQRLEEEHYKLQFKYINNDYDVTIKPDYRWTL